MTSTQKPRVYVYMVDVNGHTYRYRTFAEAQEAANSCGARVFSFRIPAAEASAAESLGSPLSGSRDNEQDQAPEFECCPECG
jgi:hypothetical protein